MNLISCKNVGVSGWKSQFILKWDHRDVGSLYIELSKNEMLRAQHYYHCHK